MAPAVVIVARVTARADDAADVDRPLPAHEGGPRCDEHDRDAAAELCGAEELSARSLPGCRADARPAVRVAAADEEERALARAGQKPRRLESRAGSAGRHRRDAPRSAAPRGRASGSPTCSSGSRRGRSGSRACRAATSSRGSPARRRRAASRRGRRSPGAAVFRSRERMKTRGGRRDRERDDAEREAIAEDHAFASAAAASGLERE